MTYAHNAIDVLKTLCMPSIRRNEIANRISCAPSCASAVSHLPIKIRFSHHNAAGLYQPQRISTPSYCSDADILEALAPQRNLQLNIILSRWHSLAVSTHTFLHELVHVYQDMSGLFCLHRPDEAGRVIQLDVPSYVRVVLFSEAWAAVEAIRSSWSLKMRGDDTAWRGAMASPDWRALSQVFMAEFRKHGCENAAAFLTFRAWYQAPIKQFYEALALRDFHALDEAHAMYDVQYRHVARRDLLKTFSGTHYPDYLADIDYSDDVYAVADEIMFHDNAVDHPYDMQEGEQASLAYFLNALQDQPAD